MSYDFSRLVRVGNKLLIGTKNNTKGLIVPFKNDEPVPPGPEPEPDEPELPDIFENVISTFYWDDRFNMRDFEYTDVIGEFRLENLPENVSYKLYLIDSEDGFVYDMEQITGTENDWEEGCLNYKKMFDVNPNLKKGFHKFYLKITTLDEKQYHIFNTPNPEAVINEFDEIYSSGNDTWYKEWESNGVLRVELPIGIESNEPEEETPENPDSVEKLIIDGKEYRTVKIGNQLWMAENLAVEIDWGNDIGGSCADTYYKDGPGGFVYNYDGVRNALLKVPDGWHLPSKVEWNTLFNTINCSNGDGAARLLKSNNGWESNNGTDEYNFTVLPVGYFDLEYMYGVGKFAYYWSSTEKDDNSHISIVFRNENDSAAAEYYPNYESFSVRLVKNI